MGKTRDLLKKIGDTKGTSHAKMGSIKDRNGMDLTETERLRRGSKNTQKNYIKSLKKKKKEKASGDDGSPAELLKILKDAAAKVLHSICQQIWKTQQ